MQSKNLRKNPWIQIVLTKPIVGDAAEITLTFGVGH